MEQIEDKEFKWYMVSTVSGKEENVIEALKNKIATQNMDNLFLLIWLWLMKLDILFGTHNM